jgi:hypothetical protein
MVDHALEEIGLRFADYAGIVWGTAGFLIVLGSVLIWKLAAEDKSPAVKYGTFAAGIAVLVLALSGASTVGDAKQACRDGILSTQSCIDTFKIDTSGLLPPSPVIFQTP